MSKAPGRKYESPRRDEQARETRRRLLDAAYRLFLEQGYSAATIPAIAEEAGVAVPTVYWVFGSKRALLMELVSHTFVGDDGRIPLAQQPWWQAILVEADPATMLERAADLSLRVLERTAGVFEVLRGAATADPEIATYVRETSDRRRQDMQSLAHALLTTGGLRPELTEEEAADLLWTMSAPDWYRMLVVERGWSPEQFKAWLLGSLTSFLLAPSS